MTFQNEATAQAMQTEASKTHSLELAFLVDPEHSKQLERILQELGNSLDLIDQLLGRFNQ
jgi:hypothetical protein